MSLILGIIRPEYLDLLTHELGKIAELNLVYILASTNIKQSAPTLVKIYLAIRSQMCLIVNLIRSKLSELSALELEKVPYLTSFTL